MNISGYQFTGPYSPFRGFKNKVSAVYVCVDNRPNLLDVGQTDDLNNRFPNHPRQICWENHSHGEIKLYIHQDANENSRIQKENSIRQNYKPPCGEK